MKRVISAVSAVLLSVTLAACASGSADTDEPQTWQEQYGDIEISDNNTETSIRLFDKISAEHENSMFSPLSLNMALGLLEAGAGGSSKAALAAYLGTENYADFAERYMEKTGEYKSQDFIGTEHNNAFEIANSLWADDSLPLKPEYIEGISEKFGAEIRSLNLGDKDETLNAVNGWVNEKTHKLIPQVLSGYDGDAAAILVRFILNPAGRSAGVIMRTAPGTLLCPAELQREYT